MSNGQVEIHDLFSSHRSDPESPSDGDRMDDSVEFRIMMAFAARRRPQQEEKKDSNTDDGPVRDNRDANGSTAPSQTPEKTETEVKKKRKKKKGWKRLSGILKCVKPQTEDSEPQRTPQNNFRSLDPSANKRLIVKSQGPDEAKEDDHLSETVSRLTEIAEEIPFTPPEWEADSSADDGEVMKLIGLILRESGDKLNEKELKDANIAAELFWNYGFFKELINKLLMRMGLRSHDPDALGPQASPKTQIAVTCEVTSRLSQVNSLPRNLLMRHGARYLQDYYSTWAQQQGGYDAAFEGDEDEVE